MFHRRFLWRVTGFPCELLEEFALPQLADDIGDIVRVSSPSQTSKAPEQEHSFQLMEKSDLKGRFETAFQVLRARLCEVIQTPRFQLAVSCSSPLAATVLAKVKNGSL